MPTHSHPLAANAFDQPHRPQNMSSNLGIARPDIDLRLVPRILRFERPRHRLFADETEAFFHAVQIDDLIACRRYGRERDCTWMEFGGVHFFTRARAASSNFTKESSPSHSILSVNSFRCFPRSSSAWSLSPSLNFARSFPSKVTSCTAAH